MILKAYYRSGIAKYPTWITTINLTSKRNAMTTNQFSEYILQLTSDLTKEHGRKRNFVIEIDGIKTEAPKHLTQKR